ncbi:MAG TPA: hypothetical protein VKA15_19400 [Isosphaeraceae bacterium]|nr:hypothetical protein [Isosphaeraceae bacterium]
MPRTVLCLAAIAAFALPCRADETVSTPETLIRLSVSPAPAPKPALRYLLLPELREMNPGNPIQNYMKCFMEQQKFFFDKEAFERRDKLLSMPLKELPAQELKDYGSFALRQADWAARLDTPDWQFLLTIRTDGVSARIPDVQEMRTLARALQVRFRAEIALGRFDDALKTAKTMFAMSRHLGEHLVFIGDLVGIAIAAVTASSLEEMLQQPGCPNLYWALTNLPVPLVSIDKGTEGERVGILAEFHDLDDSAPMSAARIKKFIAHMDKILSEPGKPSITAALDARAKDEKTVIAARRRLVEYGLPEERLLRFPALQVILLDEKREYEVRRDDTMKLMNLPIWQVQSLAADIEKANKAPTVFAETLAEGIFNVRKSQVRLDQRIALLRHVEALRLYAADHHGSLPAKLSDVSVPLPDDPSTGKPFRYEVIGNTAHLRGSPPFGEDKNPGANLHYEVSLQK